MSSSSVGQSQQVTQQVTWSQFFNEKFTKVQESAVRFKNSISEKMAPVTNKIKEIATAILSGIRSIASFCVDGLLKAKKCIWKNETGDQPANNTRSPSDKSSTPSTPVLIGEEEKI